MCTRGGSLSVSLPLLSGQTRTSVSIHDFARVKREDGPGDPFFHRSVTSSVPLPQLSFQMGSTLTVVES